MRILLGKRKGKKLKSIEGHKVRPLMGRVKKSLFDIIKDRIEESAFLDLFSGVGSVGIEALSRGAESVHFVEKDPECAEVILKNLKMCGFEKSSDIFIGDVFQFDSRNRKYDLIFLGPPYKENLVEKVLHIIGERSFLKKGGWVICQHHYKEKVNDRCGNLVQFRQKKYGITILTFFQ